MYGRWIEDFYAISLSRGITIEISFRFYVEEKVVRIKRGRRRYLNRGMQSDDRRRSSFDAPPLFAPCLAPVQIRSRTTREQLFGNFIVSRPRAKLVMFFSSLQKWRAFSVILVQVPIPILKLKITPASLFYSPDSTTGSKMTTGNRNSDRFRTPGLILSSDKNLRWICDPGIRSGDLGKGRRRKIGG